MTELSFMGKLIKAMAKSIYYFCNTILLEQEIAIFSLPELLKQKF